MNQTQTPYAVEMENIVIRFPGVLANDRVNLTLETGRDSRPSGRKWGWEKHIDERPLRPLPTHLGHDKNLWRASQFQFPA